jgi:TP901 family phage tail tape measure protein
MANQTTKLIFKGVDEASGVMKGIGKGIGGVAAGVGAVGLAAGTALVGGVAVAGVALGKFAADGVRDGIQLEQQMANIQAVMGGSSEDIANLQKLAMDLGLNDQLKVDAFEAAGAIEVLAKNGLGMEEIMDGAALATVQLANATGGDFGKSADIATDAMAQFNIGANDMDRVVNGVTAVVNKSKMDVTDFGFAIAQAGGVAGSSGVTFEDFATTMAGTASMFDKGSDAGTSFKTFLSSLTGKSGPAKDAMMDLGLMTEDGASAFFDAEGNMKSMADIAGLLDSSLSGLSDVQRTNALSTIFGSDAQRTAIGLMELGRKGFEDLSTEMGKVDAAAAMEIRMETLAGMIEIVQGQVQGLGLELFNALKPSLKQVVAIITGFISTHGPAFIAFLTDAVAWVGENLPVAMQFLRDSLAQAQPFFTQLVTAWNTQILPALKNAWTFIQENIIPILQDLGTLMGMFLAGEVTVLAALWETVLLPALLAVWAFIRDILIPGFGVLVAWLVENIPPALESLAQFWTTVLQPALMNFWTWVTENIFPLFVTLSEWLMLNLPIAIQALTDMWNNILLPALTAIWDFITNFMLPLWLSLAELFNVTLTLAITALTGLWQNILLPALTDVWDFISASLMPVFKALQEFLDEKAGPAVDTFKGIVEGLKAAFDAVKEAIGAAISKVQALIQAIKDFKLPASLTPGSPTPFEIGLRGIADALGAVNSEMKPFTSMMNSDMGGGAAGLSRESQAGSNTSNAFNLTVNTSAPSEPIIGDFDMMRSRIARV